MPESEYEVELFRKQGFTRQTCSKCSTPFWSLGIHETCVRFLDIDNVGKTGQHFTMFEMMAHHAFNFPKKFIYFKDRTVEICHLFLTERLGVDPTLVRYKESWWEGGGNSGPCFEVVFGGAEPATLVFMMNREINGHRVPMDTQVVDTGYGLERLTWLSQATTSPLEALYIVCDHSRALIFLLGDGVVPSNSREGYFARLLVRRGLRALKDLNITYSLA